MAMLCQHSYGVHVLDLIQQLAPTTGSFHPHNRPNFGGTAKL